MADQPRLRLGEILIDQNAASRQDVDAALNYSKKHHTRIGQALVEIVEERVFRALAVQFGVEYVDIDLNRRLAESIVANSDLIPARTIRDRQILPLGQQNGRLQVLMSDPMDLELLDTLRFTINPNIEIFICSPSKIRRFIQSRL